MATNVQTSPQAADFNIRKLNQAQFDRAKWYWGLAQFLKLISLVLGTATVVWAPSPWYVPILVFAVFVLAESAATFSDRVRSKAESLLRRLDYRDLLGWPIDATELATTLAEAPDSQLQPLTGAEEEYFATQEQVPAVRTLQGIKESAWWSARQAKIMAILCSVVTFTLVSISLGILLVAINLIQEPQQGEQFARLATSLLMVIFSLSIYRLILGYYNFSTSADRIVSRATTLLSQGNDDQLEAAKLLAEYHVFRAVSPPLSTLLWKVKRKKYNSIWRRTP